MRKKQLRSGYTTGACAAASAKAAARLLINSKHNNIYNTSSGIESVTITLPNGEKAPFNISKTNLNYTESELISEAATIKFAGDDPDVTNGAEITAQVGVKLYDLKSAALPMIRSLNINMYNEGMNKINIKGGRGVGIVTKPGLPVNVGFPAINPIPQKMIRDSVIEAFLEDGFRIEEIPDLTVTISAPDGEKIALKTLNQRLGIIGGISILGTTGIVKPLSSEAWTATITTSMNVAKASGCKIIVLSAGRTSEKAHMKEYAFPDEAYVMMGDYIEFALIEASKLGFKGVHISAQWAKMLKIAMSIPQTHVRYGAIDLAKTVDFMIKKNLNLPKDHKFNTAREIFEYFEATSQVHMAITEVCKSAKRYSEGITASIPVTCLLASYDGKVIYSE